MTEWRWDPAQIRSLAQEFQRLGDVINQLSQDVTSFSTTIGASSVIAAFDEVANNWWVERDKLVKELSASSDSLTQVAKSYEQNDINLSRRGS